MNLEYKAIDGLSWHQILYNNYHHWQPPLTAHLPLHSAFSPNWVFLDAALNITCLRTFPDMSVLDKTLWPAAKQAETMVTQFALDDPPFIPDYRCSAIRLVDGRYPVAEATYFAWDIYYRFEYFYRPISDIQGIIWVNATIANEGIQTRQAHVRAKTVFLPENCIFDYHYVPFYWDASKYLPCERVGLHKDMITRDGRAIGKVMPGEFACVWEAAGDYRDEDYNKMFACRRPHFVPAPLRYRNVRQAMHFSAELPAGTSRSFALAWLSNYDQVKAADLTALKAESPDISRHKSLTYFKGLHTGDYAQLEFRADAWENIFIRMQTMILQMLVRFEGREDLTPLQGGSTERHFVWVWEAMGMLRPLLQVGYFDPVRDALAFIFKLQDAGYPPLGKLNSHAGAIGTTGPRWLSTTGAALVLAVDYCSYADDAAFMSEYIPKMLRAADWILGEIRATRKLNPDGSRPLWYGLMPFGVATDGQEGLFVAWTDAWSFAGLSRMADLLHSIDHARSQEFKREVAAYRADIQSAIDELVQPNGYIENKIITGVETEKVNQKFTAICGAQQLFYNGILGKDYHALHGFTRYWEENMADGPFLGRMDRDIVYICNSELYWQDIYLRTGAWKKAFLALQTCLKYGLTADTHVAQERFSRRNPAFTPWQPNGSGSGRVLEMMLKAICCQEGDSTLLLGGIPFAWLKENGRTALNGLYVPRGRINLVAEMQGNRQCRVIFSASTARAMPRQIKFPDFFAVQCITDGVSDNKNNEFALPSGLTGVEFLLRDIEE